MKREPPEHTSERVVAEHYQDTPGEYLIYLFHTVTYRWAGRSVAGKDVLDYGCGSGYGAALLAEEARSVVGVDVASDVIEVAAGRYQHPNLRFQLVGEAGPLPFGDASFDVVTSFQVIEHVPDVDRYLAEIARVLRPLGTVLLATPNRAVRLYRFQQPWNRWHVTEYDRQGLTAVVANYFRHVELFDMTGEKRVVGIELARYRRVRLLTLPVTLPLVPDAVRRWALGVLRAVVMRRRRPWDGPPPTEMMSENDLRIVPHGEPSVNLVVRAGAGLGQGVDRR
jgi:2-polyprenyl-3-methyl-5-hydroxy-6-metoxy-1,4-benzoquinol methylase